MKEVKPGDILLVADGKSLLAKGITEFMRQYCKLNDLQYNRLYHHAAIAIDYHGRTMIAEAVGRGWIIQQPEYAYTYKEWEERVDLFAPAVPWTKTEITLLSDLAVNYSLKITRYDFMNFFFQMYMIRKGVWLGPKGAKAEGRLYCSEGVATILHKVRGYLCEEPWRYNPMDLLFEPGIVKI